MNNEPQIAVSLTISIMDTLIKGTVFLLSWKGEKAALCSCRGKTSNLFTDGDETSLYQDCREWFMEHFDGFVKITKNEGQEEKKAKQFFEEIKVLIPEFGANS